MYEDRTIGEISTGSFFAYNNRDDYYRVSIANSYPKGMMVDYEWNMVKPGWDLVKTYKDGDISVQEYAIGYHHLLRGDINLLGVSLDGIRHLAGSKPIVFLCWEREGEFCHRHLLMDFLIKIKGVM
jgi:uncharacterized protein YeaO (DUF488 family)